MRAAYAHDLWGKRDKLSGDLGTDFAFTGHWSHSVSGLLGAPYRIYDSEMGRWISRDPIAENGGINLYGYVGNNPGRFTDPTGLFFLSNPVTWFDGAGYQGVSGNWDAYQAMTWEASEQGAYAWMDGVIPFDDPFASYGFYDPCDRGNRFSQGMGGISRDALMIAAGQPVIAKARNWFGASKGTSLASTVFSKFFKGNMPFRVWTPTNVRPFALSIHLGIIMGRWTPWIGWGNLPFDLYHASTSCN